MTIQVSLLEALRNGTRERHSATEEVSLMKELMSETVGIATYLRVLQSSYATHAAVEAAIRRQADAAAGSAGEPQFLAHLMPRRAQQLAADLESVGAKASEPTRVADFIDSPAGAAGALYVLEGSRLGGNLIGRHLEKTLGLAANRGLSFYLSFDAQQLQAHWKHIKSWLESLELTPPQTAAAVAAAQATFDLFAANLKGA